MSDDEVILRPRAGYWVASIGDYDAEGDSYAAALVNLVIEIFEANHPVVTPAADSPVGGQ